MGTKQRRGSTVLAALAVIITVGAASQLAIATQGSATAASAASGDQDLYLSFNGTNQRAVGAAGFYPVPTAPASAFTVSAWVFDTTLNGDWSWIAAQQSKSTGEAFYLGTRDGSQEIWASGWGTNVRLPVNEWAHVALTRTGTTAKLYLNGVLVASTTSYDNTKNFTQAPFRIGSFVDDRQFWAGRIDQVKVYSTVLTDAQVREDQHSYGPPSGVTSLVAHYDLNEGPAGEPATGTVHNRAAGATTGDLETVNGPTYADVATTATVSGATVVTFPRSYLTAAGGWLTPAGITTARVLVVAGGGGGGQHAGGGGGGGGVLDQAGVPVTPGQTVTVTVGMGGQPGTRSPKTSGTNGGDTTFSTLTVYGGGGGGRIERSGVAASGAGQSASLRGGGGGGGARYTISSTSGGTGRFNGGGSTSIPRGGGGGGAGGAGVESGPNSTTPDGGSGVASNITGSTVRRGGGGGGGVFNLDRVQGSGTHGGGDGGRSTGRAATPGAPNTGGGGGGGGENIRQRGAAGGSGIVIVRYGGLPGAPTDVTGTAGTEQITVSWTAPASPADAPITSYTVTASPGGQTCTSTGSPPATECTVTGLQDQPYTFTVTASNENGQGPPSVASAPVTPEFACDAMEFPPLSRQPGFGCHAATAGAVGRVLS